MRTGSLVVRKIPIVLLILIVTVSILWVFAGRQVSTFVDQFKIQTISGDEIGPYMGYEGTGDGGVLFIGSLSLSLAPLNPHVGTTKDNQIAIANGGRVFSLGPVSRSTNDTLETDSSENTVTFRHARSYIPWPVFEHGVTPRLNRNEYYEYASTARNGQHLRLLWSVDSEKNATSLIRIDISSAAR